MAEDKAGNTITTLELGYEYQYQVIPEFPSFLILPLFMIGTLLVVIVYKKKAQCNTKLITESPPPPRMQTGANAK